jgi:Sigma-70, region 4
MTPAVTQDEFNRREHIVVDALKNGDDLMTEAFNSLSYRERVVVSKLIGLNTEKQTKAEVADAFNVTRERIRQIYVQSIKKLYSMLFDDGSQDEAVAMGIGQFPAPTTDMSAVGKRIWCEFCRENFDCDHFPNDQSHGVGSDFGPYGELLARAQPANWANLLLERDNVQGRAALERFVQWYEENDGNSDDFGELFIVKDAKAALADD